MDASKLAGARAARTAWEAAGTDCTGKQDAAQAAVQLKGDCRQAFEDAVRVLVRKLQASAEVSDDERRALGITVRNGSGPASYMAPPPSRPIATVNTSQRLRHEIRFVNENTPTRRARPAGTIGCEIWAKVGSAPKDPGERTLVALAQISSCVVKYGGADAGKTAYYMLCWMTTRGQAGLSSETVAATITG